MSLALPPPRRPLSTCRVVNSALFDPTLVLAHSPIAGLITVDFYDPLTCLFPPQRGELHGGHAGWGHTHPGLSRAPYKARHIEYTIVNLHQMSGVEEFLFFLSC